MDPHTFDDKNATLAKASKWLMDVAVDGAICPCCERYTKIYRRSFNAGMAVCLLWLARAYARTGDYLHVPTVAPRRVLASREFDKLRLFGAAETKDVNEDEDKRTSGLWRPTQLGLDMAHQRVNVPDFVVVYNGRVIETSIDLIPISEALGTKFSYTELMSGDIYNLLSK